MKTLLAVSLGGAAAMVAGGALYFAGVKYLHWPIVRPLLRPAFVRAYLTDPRLRELIEVMDDERVERADAFEVFWSAGNTELVSRRLFRPVEMYGAVRYMYRPHVKTLQFLTGAAGLHRAMEMEDSPALRRALSRLDTKRLAQASYDAFGFRSVDPELTRGCATRVLFLGDSFTDGVGVNDGETFVNRYGHLVRDRLGLAMCPVNAGVEGYGSLEESYVLETYYDELGRPPIVVVMHFANDVDDDEDAVVRGAVPEGDPRWARSLRFVERMAAMARERNAVLLLAAIPAVQQFSAPATRRHYQDVLRRFCEPHGIGFVDLFEPIARAGPKAAYFDDDPHWTPAGHQAAAQALFDATRGLLSP